MVKRLALFSGESVRRRLILISVLIVLSLCAFSCGGLIIAQPGLATSKADAAFMCFGLDAGMVGGFWQARGFHYNVTPVSQSSSLCGYIPWAPFLPDHWHFFFRLLPGKG